MVNLYQLKVAPIVTAMQFTGDIEEVKEFLLGSESEIYCNSDGNLVVDGISLDIHDYVVETDNGIEIFSEESFIDRYKRIY